jgi:hypothetical protein
MEYCDDDNKITSFNFKLDNKLSNKLYNFFLLEQYLAIINEDDNKIKQLFEILNNFEQSDEYIKDLTGILSIYLYFASERKESIHNIIFTFIKNNKFNISFENIGKDGNLDIDIINSFLEFQHVCDYKNYHRRLENQSYNILSCITNLIRDNKINGLQLYHDNNLILEEYYDDIKQSLEFFKCNNDTLNFFNKNYNITIN